MILVVGGRASGKREYVRNRFALEPMQVSPDEAILAPVIDSFQEVIRQCPEVLECSLVTGMDADYQLKVVVPDMDHYQKFLLGQLTRIEGVTSVRSSFVLNQVLSSTELPLEHLRS